MLYKFGEAFTISESNLLTEESVLADPAINERFKKFAGELKKLAPKADNFLYFSAVMMHAAESSLLNSDGSTKLLANGKKAEARWEAKGDSLRWISNDPSIMPYKNANSDIFPENELLAAYKKWIGKPLCIDHKSNSVDHIRGVIVDTYYDRPHKRVIALCALDKVNYPDLARKVSTGVAASVSMGTAVQRAICTDCGQVARTEKDFCNHMRTKSSYGEINCDLEPIELSIVVNGADKLAKIKHIIASANHLNDYAATKEQEIHQVENKVEAAALCDKLVTDIKSGLDNLVVAFKEVTAKTEEAKSTSEKLDIKASEVVDTSSAEDNNSAYSQTNSASEIEDAGNNEPEFLRNQLAERFAADNNAALVEKFNYFKSSIENKLAEIKTDFNNLSDKLSESRNMTMEKKGYFQGAGGANEPTPGQPKYEVDAKNQSLRTDGDKHMEGQMDTGPVEGMHPGPESVGMSELDRKKMLARAEADQRALKRQAALDSAKRNLVERTKTAYFQGGGGVNEPTPGKPKYEKENAELTREKGDKHMNGQSPFPGVGKVDGLHPSPESADQKDELKRKEMLSRASLKAKFIKSATSTGDLDRGASSWQVFADDKLVLTASVNDLSAGRVDALYDTIATKDFGSKLLQKVKNLGVDKTASLYKKSQMPEMPGAAPPAPAAAAPAAPAAPDGAPVPDAAPPGADMSPETADKGGAGGPADAAKEILGDVKNRMSDLGEAIEALSEEKKEVDASPAPAADGVVTASLQKMRLELNSALTSGMKQTVAKLQTHAEELDMVAGLYGDRSVTKENRDFVGTLAADAIDEAKKTLAESFDLVKSFVKYAEGTKAMLKRASRARQLQKQAQMLEMDLTTDGDRVPHGRHGHRTKDDLEVPMDDDMTLDMNEIDQMLADVDMDDDGAAEGAAMADDNAVMVEVPAAKVDQMKDLTVKADFDLNTKEGRAAYRTKLAADSMKYSDILDQAHPDGGPTVKTDGKTEGDLAKVETLEERHEKMLEVAKAPPKVRKEAEEIHKLVVAGKLDVSQLDALVSHGLDAAAVKYYKQYFAQAEGGSEFAGELVKEHAKAKADEEFKGLKVKLARAYDLAYQMVDRGLCARSSETISAQVDEIMKYNDDAFESLKRVVAKHAPSMTKQASRLPAVGIDSGDAPGAAPESDNLYDTLSKMFSNRRF